MDEFKRLPWPVSDLVTDFQQTYALNMPDFQQRNPMDVFFCDLMEIDPLHLQAQNQNQNQSAEAEDLAPRQFIDPRTGIEIPSHVCNYKTIDLKTRNIFLTKYIQASNLKRHEHSACLNALACLSKPENELSNEEKKDRLLFNSTSVLRCEEKKAFLQKLRERSFEEVPNRFHIVPPSIEYFVTQNWKKQLITLHRQFANAKFSLKTGILLQSSECVVSTDVVHQERLGCVPQMSRNLEYLRQSFPNLVKAHNMRKNTHQLDTIKEKVKELVQQNAIDFVIPISVLKCILSSKSGWSLCMTVKESALSTVFNPKRETIFEKPLPLAYLSGNDRYRKGAKYLLHSCLNANTSHIYNHDEKVEARTIPAETVECDFNPNTAIEYKVLNCDEFIRNHSRREDSYGNMTFTIFDVKGYDSAEDINESLKILVPTKQAAYEKESDGEIKFVNFSPKIEFQAEYGAEVMSKDELLSEWCELYFRPNTSTRRVRFDCLTGKVIYHQLITLIDVENELKANYGIETQQLLQRLWHALQTFNDFPPGDYLLQSDTKQLDSIKIFEKTKNSTNSLGISQIMKSGTILEKNLLDKVDWQPIDDHIVTDIHKNYQVLPCAFPHSEYLKENNVKSPQGHQIKQTRAAAVTKMLKICPKNDTKEIIQRAESVAKLQKNRSKMRNRDRLKKKSARCKERRNARRAAQKSEVDALESTKRLLAATMDQFIPSDSLQSTSNLNPGSSGSIAERTRRKSKCDNFGTVQPTTMTKPFTRRSSRASMN